MTRDELDKEKNKEVSEELGPVKKVSPFVYILALFIILIFILSFIPYYAVTLDPNPKNIPTLQEVVPTDLVAPSEYYENIYVAARNVDFADPQLKQISATIAARSCSSSKICHAKALFYFVRNNIAYVSDPRIEYVEYPLETLKTGGADCDGQALLLAALAEAVGISSRIALVPGHAYVEVYVEGSSKRYQNSDGWIPLDPTCKNCDFGEIPQSNILKEKTYLRI